MSRYILVKFNNKDDKQPMSRTLKSILSLSIIFLCLSGSTLAHDPIFGIGPRTIWQYGYGFEMGYQYLGLERSQESQLTYHTMFGATEDWTLILETHQDLHSDFSPFSHIGELGFRTKYRFFKKFAPGAIYQVSFIGGTNIPTGGAHHATDSYFGGLAASYEGRTWLLFASGRYKFSSTNDEGFNPGNAFLYDLALGYRPFQTGYYQPDIVLMGELNGQVFGEKTVGGRAIERSKASRLLAGFGTWITWRNWAFKPGIQLPVYNTIRNQDFNMRFVASVEIHL